LVRSIPARPPNPSVLIWMPDSRKFLESTTESVYLRDSTTGATLGVIPGGFVDYGSGSISSDGRWALGRDTGLRPAILDLVHLTRKPLKLPDQFIAFGQFSPKGDRIAYSQVSGQQIGVGVRIVSFPGLTNIAYLNTRVPIKQLTFSPDGSHLAVG